MKYDFETIIDRTDCGSSKWDSMKQVKPTVNPGVIPLSVADMEFKMAPEIVKGLKEYIDTHVLGYTRATDAYINAVIAWQKERHGLALKKEWLETSSGVVPALSSLISILSKPGEGVIIMPPVYYPFSFSTILNDRELVRSPLVNTGETYEIDFNDFEEKAKDPKNTLLIFCNPHNPVGRVWTKDELQRVSDICITNGVFIIDDEIHNDLIMPGYTHTPMPSLSDEALNNCAYCTAASKTFNLAGMQASNIFIADEAKRKRYSLKKMMNMSFSLNTLGYESTRIAYTECKDWLDELLSVIDGNAKYLTSFFKENIPEVKPYRLEGTYLFWADFRGLGMTHMELENMMIQDGDIFLDEGYMFGPLSRGFERFNIACPRKTLEAACTRLLAAVETVRSRYEKDGKSFHFLLEESKPMPDFDYSTQTGKKKSFLAETKGNPTVLIFHRYLSCGFTQKIIEEITEAYPKIEKAGIQIKLVVQSTPESASNYTAAPFDIICDHERKLYTTFNVFPASSNIELLEGIGTDIIAEMGIDVMSGGGACEGNQLQLPAAVLIDADGVILHAKYGKTLSDIPTIKELTALLTASSK